MRVLIGSDQIWRVLTGDVSLCEDNKSVIAMIVKLGGNIQVRATCATSYPAAKLVMVYVSKAQEIKLDGRIYMVLLRN